MIRLIRQRQKFDEPSECQSMRDAELDTIDALLRERGRSRADLGRLLGLDSAQVSRLFAGKRRLQMHEAKKVQAWLGAPENIVDISTPVPAAAGMIPLYGWVGAASQSRLTFADQTIRGLVPAHPNQAHVRDAFALEVSDISMSPRYEPGEIVFVIPNRWPSRQQDCVIVTKDGCGFLKRFIRRDAEGITCLQLNPESLIEFPIETVLAVHTVVGRG
jgi:phage repressor protein C with HTH and peptisase S24 domain